MRVAKLRLGAALLLCGLTGNALIPPFGEASAVIAMPQKLLGSNEIDRVDPADPEAPLTEYIYDAQFLVTSQLAGPDLGKDARITFIGDQGWRQSKLFMIVHRDGLGRLWARRAWLEVGSRLCLSQQQVIKLNLTAAFATADDNEKGQRCISV